MSISRKRKITMPTPEELTKQIKSTNLSKLSRDIKIIHNNFTEGTEQVTVTEKEFREGFLTAYENTLTGGVSKEDTVSLYYRWALRVGGYYVTASIIDSDGVELYKTPPLVCSGEEVQSGDIYGLSDHFAEMKRTQMIATTDLSKDMIKRLSHVTSELQIKNAKKWREIFARYGIGDAVIDIEHNVPGKPVIDADAREE